MFANKGYPNRLGVWGWLGGGRWGENRYLYTLHRVTGLGILAYFLLHILVTSSRAFGEASWKQWMTNVSGPGFKVGEYLVFLAFAFHAINGIRLGSSSSGSASAGRSSRCTRTGPRSTSSARSPSACWCSRRSSS